MTKSISGRWTGAQTRPERMRRALARGCREPLRGGRMCMVLQNGSGVTGVMPGIKSQLLFNYLILTKGLYLSVLRANILGLPTLRPPHSAEYGT